AARLRRRAFRAEPRRDTRDTSETSSRPTRRQLRGIDRDGIGAALARPDRMIRDLLVLCAIVLTPAIVVVASARAVGDDLRTAVAAANHAPRTAGPRCR